jgi:thiamine biosynthesis lipoprotein
MSSTVPPVAGHRTHRRAMGTVASVHVHDPRPVAVIDRAVDAMFAELERLEDIFSTFRPHSDISRCNRGEISLFECAPEVLDVLDACTWLEHESDGAFCARRPTPPFGIDPAGFVKGWAAERAAGALRDAGLASWYVAIGGDIVTCGTPPGASAWRFGIAHPFDPSRIVAELDVPGGSAVATSGTGARGRHIWNGARRGHVASRAGAAAETPYASLTVVGPSLTWTDALATAAFARGAGALDWLRRFPDHTAFAFDADGVVLGTTLAGGR